MWYLKKQEIKTPNWMCDGALFAALHDDDWPESLGWDEDEVVQVVIVVRVREVMGDSNGPLLSRVLIEEAQFVAFGLHCIYNVDIAIDLDFVRRSIPFPSHRRSRMHLVELRDQVLSLGQLQYSFVVEQDIDALLVDPDGSKYLGRFDIGFHRDAIDKVFQRSLHEIHRSVILVVWCLANKARLYVEASH